MTVNFPPVAPSSAVAMNAIKTNATVVVGFCEGFGTSFPKTRDSRFSFLIYRKRLALDPTPC